MPSQWLRVRRRLPPPPPSSPDLFGQPGNAPSATHKSPCAPDGENETQRPSLMHLQQPRRRSFASLLLPPKRTATYAAPSESRPKPMPQSTLPLDTARIRAEFPAFRQPNLKDVAFFENAGGSY